MYEYIIDGTFIMFLAMLLAGLEIEVEGRFGWAYKLPTFYRVTGFWARLYGMVMAGKPLTGYHLFMFFFILGIFHLPLVMVPECRSWTTEFKTMAWYFAFCPLWDFLWFVLNPFYVGKFKKWHIFWHGKSYWVFGLFPIDYLHGVVLSVVFSIAAMFTSGKAQYYEDHVCMLMVCGAILIIVKALSPLYHRLYLYMHDPRRDERDLVEAKFP